MRVLMIIAAGNSNRMGGYPKFLCKVNQAQTNLEHTYKLADDFFDEVILILNNKKETEEEISKLDISKMPKLKIYKIESGFGDYDAIVKSLNFTNENEIVVCWGDAYFVEKTVFNECNVTENKGIATAICSYDKMPYAWFDVDEFGSIKKSHFLKNEQPNNQYEIHDQCIFLINKEKIFLYDDSFRKFTELNNKTEYKLLDFFEFSHNCSDKSYVKLIDGGFVISFNNKQELEQIIQRYGKK